MGPTLVKKSLEEGLISQNLQNKCKISRFEAEKPLEMGLDLRKFMGRGFRPRAAHSVKK